MEAQIAESKSTHCDMVTVDYTKLFYMLYKFNLLTNRLPNRAIEFNEVTLRLLVY